jgi:predicted GNAT family N-acyltransferase
MAIAVCIVTGSAEREQAFDIRRRVFQEEQGVPADEEFDADDARATHVLATAGATPVGTARIVFHVDYAKIGRMAVLKAWRRRGVGRALMAELTHIAAARNVLRLVLHAQVQAIPFYTALDFQIVGDAFEEAGIPHRRMERRLNAAQRP